MKRALTAVAIAVMVAGGAQAWASAAFQAGSRDTCGGAGTLGPSVGVGIRCGGGPGGSKTPGRTGGTAPPGTPTPTTAPTAGPGETSVPMPNDWGYASCPSGAGSNAVLPVTRYGPGGRPAGSVSVICPSEVTTSTTGLPPPPPPSSSQVWAKVPLPASLLEVNPGADGITQLPSWFWAAGAGAPVTVTVDIGEYTVSATASPTAYRWDFGDGAGSTSGRAGSEGDPAVVHTYSRRGTYTVGLEVEYSGTYTFGGPGGSGSSALGQYWEPSVTASYTVQEVRSVLVPSGNG